MIIPHASPTEPKRGHGDMVRHSHPHVTDSAGHTSVAYSYLSLLGVWTESCPLVEACGFMMRDVLAGAEETQVAVVRSTLLWLLPVVSSAGCALVTSFQSCCSSAGIMPETNKLDN